MSAGVGGVYPVCSILSDKNQEIIDNEFVASLLGVCEGWKHVHTCEAFDTLALRFVVGEVLEWYAILI